MKREADKRQLCAHLHTQLRANYRGLWNEETDALCKRLLTQIYGEIGAERLQRAALSCMAEESFFQEHALRRHIPAVTIEHRRCSRCQEADGFVYVQTPGESWPRVKKCDHKSGDGEKINTG